MNEKDKAMCMKRAARVIEAACIDEGDTETIEPLSVVAVALREAQRIIALMDGTDFDPAGYGIDLAVDQIIMRRLNKRFL